MEKDGTGNEMEMERKGERVYAHETLEIKSEIEIEIRNQKLDSNIVYCLFFSPPESGIKQVLRKESSS